jgi:hypothetical protein
MNTNNKFILSIAAGSIVVVFLSLIIYKTNGNTNDDKSVKVINNSTDYNKLNENPDDYTTYADFEEKESDKEKENIRKATQEDDLNYKFPGMEGGKTKKNKKTKKNTKKIISVNTIKKNKTTKMQMKKRNKKNTQKSKYKI